MSDVKATTTEPSATPAEPSGAPAEPYHEGARRLQQRFDTRRLADLGAEALFGEDPAIDAEARAFIERMSMVFIASADGEGRPHCSYKGGAPGFVRVHDAHTLVIPNYDGNGFYQTWGNVLHNPRIDLLFIDFEAASPWRLRVSGLATIHFDDPLAASYHEAQFVVRIRPTRMVPVCPRYVHRMRIVESSRFVPSPGTSTPVAEWKLDAELIPPDVLPVGDRARVESERRVRDPQRRSAPPTHGPFPSAGP